MPHSGSPEILSSTFPERVLDNILPTGTPSLIVTSPNLTTALPRISYLDNG